MRCWVRERPSARLIVLDPRGRVLLFRFAFDDGALAGQRFWATPGGALAAGEDYAAAARRELLEEAGIDADVGPEVARRDVAFMTPDGDEVAADERYFAVRVATAAVDTRRQTALEQRVMVAHRWWAVAELRATAETVYPADLADLVAALVNRR